MTITSPYYPIIYVRGYAATMGEIENTVATPYMGFNLGSTKIRQDYDGDIVPFVFESPLIRLMKDEGYIDSYRDGKFVPRGQRVPAKSVWIFRYYEPVSEDLGSGQRQTIPRFALELRKFILRIRDHVCGDDQDARDKFKVYLVAHSMGGLICRTYLQNICRNGVPEGISLSDITKTPGETLELDQLPADPMVDKVFTYATPHNGIELKGINVPDVGTLDPVHVRNFNRSYMREYLSLPEGEGAVNKLDGAFPSERFFCFVGTNYKDYDAFFGLSKKGTGAMSDGLVMIKNASVDTAPRAFAHRSHSGHYGIVNSEEGYQNLKRFLFGDLRVDVKLLVDEITLPKEIMEEVDGNLSRVKAAYNIETSAKIRGLNVALSERMVRHGSAIRLTYEELVHAGKPAYLFSGYLQRKAKMSGAKDTAMAFAVEIGVQVPVYEIDNSFWFDEHFEGGLLFKETVIFHVRRTAQGETIRYGLASETGMMAANRPMQPSQVHGKGATFELPLGFKEGAARKPMPGLRGRLVVDASLWNTE
ncbi:hypothetical protein EOI86_05075 [Hwanghaeella grinnelliae]|uniref:Alpha/beta hydrolase n=1 Tax=Hwanghaeella grinnelliae TaxID=2500179 RepID=A0A3S2VPL1_9PROT|nr:hypothetical protein [Hwanghaeella grinnelliae]RVU38650.1 hypothetical protein EOI86_05075 [Hwanghaeella grinnelliae]